MECPFLTIAEACERTGRSPSTIRRLIHAITTEKAHPDRKFIEPSPAAVEGFRRKGENFTWKIREDVLLKNFQGALTQEKKSVSVPTLDVLSLLQRELELKNRQIEKQWETIQALNERLREGNILMGSLQKRLALPSPDVVGDATAKLNSTSKPRKSSTFRKPSAKASTTVAVKKPTRMWILRWMKR